MKNKNETDLVFFNLNKIFIFSLLRTRLSSHYSFKSSEKKKMKKFSTTILKIAGLGSISIAWMLIVILVLLGSLSFPAFGFFT